MAAEERPVRVLHVDDQAAFAETTAAFLRQESDRFEIESATSASEGMDFLSRESFDCIVSDYEMPAQNGIDFLETVREDDPNLPFILFTGKGSEEIAAEAISAGVTDYLQKGSDTSHFALLANRIVNAVEQYRSRIALADSQERLSLVIEQSPLGFVEYNQDFEIVRVNDTLEEMFGYSEAELLGKTWEVFVTSESYDHVNEVTSALTDATGGYHSINENVRKDGERLTVEWHNRIVTDESGDTITIFSHCQDVTERKNHERNLAQLRAFFAEAEQLGMLGAWEFDETGVSTWTAGTRRIHEVDDDFEPTVANGIEFYHPEDRDRVRRVADRALEHGEPYDIQARLVTAKGNQRWVRTRGKRIDTGDETLVRGFIQDITDQKEYERKLESRNDRLEEFASVVSHDLQNPLSVAQGQLQLARSECDSDNLDTVADAQERMQTLIDDILTLAREGDREAQVQPIDLDEIAEVCWQTVRTPTAMLVIDTDRTVLADPSQLQRLFENLFSNAVEHGSEDARITVGDLEDDTGFYVADDGQGVQTTENKRVFEAGYSTATDGTGFGLAIVQAVVKAHGWDISVTDSRAGGARFEISGVDWPE